MAGPGQARFYSSTFVQTSLSAGISAGTLTFNVGTTTGAPSTPFVVSVDQNTASEELMLITNISGLQYTATRGVGGTSAVNHSNGASVVHVMYAQDLTDASAHIGAFDAVHGLSTGSLVVGTTDTQTLTNKTLTSPSLSSATLTGTTTAAAITSSGAVTGVDFVPTGLTGAVAVSRYVGATASGAPASGTFAVGDFVIDQSGLVWVCTVAGTPGTWISLVNTSAAQTLTNKTLSAPVLTGTATGSGSINIGTGFVRAMDFQAAGRTGATTASTYAGGTASGAPTSGTFSLGDFIIDQTGLIWVCTAAGTPGTWVSLVNTSATQTLSNKTLSSPVLTGTMTGAGQINTSANITGTTVNAAGTGSNTAFSSYAGGTNGGPGSGTPAVQGQFIVDNKNGVIWVCTAAGTPGTWTPVSNYSGAGYATNMVTGGANITSTQAPFNYSSSKTVSVTAGSGWSATFTDATFHGVGSFCVTPGNNAGGLGFLTIIPANCNITSNQLTLAGAAFTSGAAGVATSTNIVVNVNVSAW